MKQATGLIEFLVFEPTCKHPCEFIIWEAIAMVFSKAGSCVTDWKPSQQGFCRMFERLSAWALVEDLSIYNSTYDEVEILCNIFSGISSFSQIIKTVSTRIRQVLIVIIPASIVIIEASIVIIPVYIVIILALYTN